MPKKTQREMLLTAINARGEKQLATRATNYVAFTRSYRYERDSNGALVAYDPVKAEGYKYFVTRGGALRTGNRTFAQSFSVDPVNKAQLMNEGK